MTQFCHGDKLDRAFEYGLLIYTRRAVMFTKESLRKAFERLSKLDRWNDYVVEGGKSIGYFVDDEPYLFSSHEAMIEALVNNEKLLQHINENAQTNLPCFEISSDSDIGQLIDALEADASGLYDVKGYITKETVFKMGSSWDSSTAGIISCFNSYATYITESGNVIVCNEWSYEQNITDEVEKPMLVYRRQCRPKNIDCSVLADFFDEFEGVFDK